MKIKLTRYLIVLVFIVLSSSCKKTWYCVCNYTDGGSATTPIGDVNKRGAKSVCWQYEEQTRINGRDASCSIK